MGKQTSGGKGVQASKGKGYKHLREGVQTSEGRGYKPMI